MKKYWCITLMTFGLVLTGANAIAWEWDETFYENGTRLDIVDCHGDDEDQSYSYIINYDDDVTWAEATILTNVDPAHWHVIEHPAVYPTVHIKWTDQPFDLINRDARMRVLGGNFETSEERVEIHLEYPY